MDFFVLKEIIFYGVANHLYSPPYEAKELWIAQNRTWPQGYVKLIFCLA